MFYKIKNTITGYVIDEFNGYDLHDKFYKFGAVLLGFSFIVTTLQIFIFDNAYFNRVMNVFYPMMALTFSVGALLEFWHAIKELLSKSWVKWVGGVVSFFVFKFAQAQSDDFINDLTGIDPSFLSFSSSVLTAIYLPYSWLVLVSVLISMYFFLHWMFLPFEKLTNKRQLEGWRYFARLMGVSVVFIALSNLLNFYQDSKSFPSMVAQHIVINTEYFSKTNCKNVTRDELSADIGGGYISIFNKSDKKFRIDVCDLSYLKNR